MKQKEKRIMDIMIAHNTDLDAAQALYGLGNGKGNVTLPGKAAHGNVTFKSNKSKHSVAVPSYSLFIRLLPPGQVWRQAYGAGQIMCSSGA